MGLAQDLSGARAILQRHCGERHEALLALGQSGQMLVDHLAPAQAFFGRQFVAEHVEPATGNLTVDALLIHPLEASGDIGQGFGHRTRGLAACEGETKSTGRIVDKLQRGKRGRIGADRLKQARRADMGMAVDDHRWLTLGLRRPRRSRRRGRICGWEVWT